MDQEYSKRFYASLAPAYDWIFGRSLEAGRREAVLRVHEGQRVLEVGVGTGLSLKHYPSDCRVVGIDICPQMLRRARWRALSDCNGTHVTIKRMDATHLTFPDASFDVVVAPYVITTVGDPHQLCNEMRRVCKKGGLVIVVSNTLEAGLLGAIKCAISPITEKIGFRTDLDVGLVLKEAGLRLLEAPLVNPLRIHRLFVAERV